MYTKKENAEFAEQAWSELVLIAEQKDTIFYNELGSKIGISNPQEVRHALSPIQEYCLNYDEVPHLTSLVVNRETGKPGYEYTPKLETTEEDWNAVYAFNWKDHPNPGYAVFLEYATGSTKKSMPYSEQEKWCILAVKGWKILIAHAKKQKSKPEGKRKPLTYKQFGSNSKINLPHIKAGKVLRPIQSYICANNLPWLNSLVVRRKDHLPGSEYKGSLIKLDVFQSQNNVYDFDWDSIHSPSCSDFMAVYNPDL